MNAPFGSHWKIPKNWKIISIKDISSDWRGGAPFEPEDFTDQGYPVLHKGAIQRFGEILIDSKKKTFTTESFVQSHQKSIIDQSYLAVTLRDLVPSGPSIGLIADLANSSSQQYILAQGAYGFHIDRDQVNPNFLVWLSNYEPFRLYMKSYAVGSTQIHIRTPVFQELKIPLPPIAQQRRIAEILDRADAVRRKRREAIELTEELLRSAFLEMFGDPVTNPKGWEESKVENLLVFLTSGSRGWAQYYASQGSLFLRIQNVKGGKLLLDDVAYVTPPDSAEARRTCVQEGDVLVSITADLGRTAVIPKGLKSAYINQHLALLRLKREKVSPVYVAAFLASIGGQLQFERLNREGVKAGLNFDDIKGLKILLPPLKIQQKYEDFFIQQTYTLNRYQQSCDEAQDLFNSLLQRAFRGEV